MQSIIERAAQLMTTERKVNDIEGFCNVLLASGLVSVEAITAMVEAFRSQASTDTKFGTTFTAFTSYLVTNQILTCWQIAKLRHGQYKGFFLDGYRIVDSLGSNPNRNRYLAEEGESGKCVVVCVRPPDVAPLKDGMPEYWVEELPQ